MGRGTARILQLKFAVRHDLHGWRASAAGVDVPGVEDFAGRNRGGCA